MSFTEQLQHVTVRIEVELPNGGLSTGTGFFFHLCEKENQHVPVLVTNKHVIRDGKRGKFRMTTAKDDGSPDDINHIDVFLDNVNDLFVCHPNGNVDLAVLPIASLLTQAKDKNKNLFYRTLGKNLIPTEKDEAEFTAVEDILMIGYPNGIWDRINNKPVFRKGITATHPAYNYNGKDEFLIDAACFPGSSGSPVILFNLGSYAAKDGSTIIGSRFKFLGILYGGPQYTISGDIQIVDVPTLNIPVAVSQIPINLGNVIKAKKLLDFEALLSK